MEREPQQWRTADFFISDKDLTEWLRMQTAHRSVQYKYRPDGISLPISARPACGSALMPRQGGVPIALGCSGSNKIKNNIIPQRRL